MRFSLSTNFDDKLISSLPHNKISFFGKLPQDLTGGGRPAHLLPELSKEQLKNHIQLIHHYGHSFNYLLNAGCLDNLEFTRKFKCDFIEMLDWLDFINVDSVTVTLPVLIPLIKERVPDIEIHLSSYANIDSLEKAKRFEQMGVQEITIMEDLNRDFRLLKIMRKELSCDLRLIATNSCITACPYRSYHINSNAHASQINHISKGFYFDYSIMRCMEAKLQNPIELLKANWIRPEDLHFYQEIGYDLFKITERFKTTDQLVKTFFAYYNQEFNGNLMALLGTYAKDSRLPLNQRILQEIEEELTPELARFFPFFSSLEIFEIENRKLDGFLDYFVQSNPDCMNMQCGKECSHCLQYLDAIKYDEKVRQSLLESMNDSFSGLQKERL